MEDEPELYVLPYLGDEAVDDAHFYEDLLEIYSGRVEGATALVTQKARTPAADSSVAIATASAAADPVSVAPASSSDASAALVTTVGAEEQQQGSTAASGTAGNKRGRRTRATNARQNSSEKLNATIGSVTAGTSSSSEPPPKRGRRGSLAATRSNGSASAALQVSAQSAGRSIQMQLSLKALDDYTLSDMVEFLYTRFDDWANFEPPLPSASCSSALEATLEQQKQKQKATTDEPVGVECVDEAAIFKPTPNDIALAPMAAAPLSLFFSIASLVERSSKVNHYAILRRYSFQYSHLNYNLYILVLNKYYIRIR